jgi:hypothetical protein
MDALYFGMVPSVRLTQFKTENILRELNKAFLGFSCVEDNNDLPIATG